MNNLITILGPTATGKTAIATELAYRLNGEVISADSRQVFRGMDIGTGKDLADYHIHGVDIPYHLIDICDPTEEYNAYRFMGDFRDAYNDIVSRGRVPIMCGGTGLYLDAVIRGYKLADAPVDPDYRATLAPYSDEELTERLASYVKLHNHTDTETRERLVRALEIQEFARQHPDEYIHLPHMHHLVFGVEYSRQQIASRIETRLQQRLDDGMIDEVRQLLAQGVAPDRLLRFGLEYRHCTRYLLGLIGKAELFNDLFADIRHFAKRQSTWFRRMERNGVKIHWIDGSLPLNEKVAHIAAYLA